MDKLATGRTDLPPTLPPPPLLLPQPLPAAATAKAAAQRTHAQFRALRRVSSHVLTSTYPHAAHASVAVAPRPSPPRPSPSPLAHPRPRPRPQHGCERVQRGPDHRRHRKLAEKKGATRSQSPVMATAPKQRPSHELRTVFTHTILHTTATTTTEYRVIGW